MNEYIQTPTVGEVIVEEFMKPLDMNIIMLANSLDLGVAYIRAILDGDVKVTAELSKKLADYFGMSELSFSGFRKTLKVVMLRFWCMSLFKN